MSIPEVSTEVRESSFSSSTPTTVKRTPFRVMVCPTQSV